MGIKQRQGQSPIKTVKCAIYLIKEKKYLTIREYNQLEEIKNYKLVLTTPNPKLKIK